MLQRMIDREQSEIRRTDIDEEAIYEHLRTLKHLNEAKVVLAKDLQRLVV